MAGKPEADRTALLTAICAHVRPFGDEPLRNLSFPEFLDLLGWVTAIKPVLLRFPILHWLAVWAARHKGLQLAYPAFVVLTSDKNERYLGTGPLHPARWRSELAEQERWQLDFPGNRGGASGRERLLESSTANPAVSLAWEEFLDRPPVVDPSSVQTMLDNLSVVANYQSPTMASALALLAKPYHLPARITQSLGSVTTTATLVLAAKSLWETCPPGSRPRLAQELEAFVKKVTDKFGGPDQESKQRTTLAAVSDTAGLLHLVWRSGDDSYRRGPDYDNLHRHGPRPRRRDVSEGAFGAHYIPHPAVSA